MRTTIELTDEQHAAVIALARKQGERGLSPIIQTAVDLYLGSLSAEDTEVALGLEGTVGQEEAEEMLAVYRESRGA